MKCPHCLVEFHDANLWAQAVVKYAKPNEPIDNLAQVMAVRCPACQHVTVKLLGVAPAPLQVFPQGCSRAPLPAQVPDRYAADYREACAVLNTSAKASAALSRRLLQSLIRETAGITARDLATEIAELINSKTLPSYLSDAIDSVRAIGNFAAHPIKSTNSGEIVDVEPGEAEWLLDTVESLFDFYFVQPDVLKAKRDALNAKLRDVNKPPVK